MTPRLILVFALGQFALAQRFPFEAYGERELRSAPRALFQDRDGALWIANETQLFRFDGHRLASYPTPGDIHTLTADPEGRVWGAGHGGVQRMTPPSPVFSKVVLDRLFAPATGVLVGGNEQGTWVSRAGQPFVLTKGALVGVTRDVVWTMCGEAPLCSSPQADFPGGRTLHTALPSDGWIDIQQASDGTLWLLGQRNLFHRSAKGEWEREDLPTKDPVVSAPLALNSRGEPVLAAGQRVWWKRQQKWISFGAREGLGGTPQALYFDQEDSLWAGTTRGLFRLLGEGRWQYWNERNGLDAFHLSGLARDAAGALWIGGREQTMTLREGVVKPQAPPVNDVRQAPDGSVWLATDKGVGRWAGGTQQSFATPPAQSLAFAKGATWAATSGGLWTSQGNRLLTCPLTNTQAMREVHADPDGNVWASTADGLLRYDGASWQRYGKAEGLRDNNIGPFIVDANGWIWLGYPDSNVLTWAEWSPARRQTLHYDNAPLPAPPTFIRHDALGRIWIGTSQGLVVTDGEKLRTRYRKGDGLIDDDVSTNGFHEDPDGSIWIATARGLSRFTPPDDPFRGSGLAPAITLTVEGHAVTPESIGPESRSIAFLFGSSAFVDPYSVRYRYRLVGFDSDWQTEQRNFVRYPNLAPGSYTFEAQTVSAAGVPSARSATIAFRVLAPWYLTWWFRGVLLALAAAVARWLWQWRLRLAESANQRRVEAMMDEYPGPVCMVDADGRFRTVNREFVRLAGLPREAIVGCSPADVHMPFIKGQLADALAAGAKTNDVTVWEPAVETPRGHVDLDARVFSLRNDKGAIDSVCFVGTDITERKRAERERDRAERSLRESEQRYRVFLENSQEGMLRIEFTPPIPTDLPAEEIVRLFYERGEMAECNDAHARLRGFASAADLIGQRGTALRDPDLHRAQDLAFVRHGFRLTGLPGVLKSVTGEKRHVLYNVVGIVKNGQLERIWGTTQDMTEAKRLEEALRALSARQATAVEEERSRISREIHDELGQQLTALKMDLTLLQRTPSRERLDELIQHIDGAVQTVRRIATELRPAILDHFGLAAAVEWQTAEFTKRSGLAHTVDVPDQLHVPRDLAITIFRILQEALTNVARHAQAEHVEVILRETPEEITLRVVDDGRGFPEKKSDRPSLGILNMRERAAAFGGTLTIGPARPRGTEVLARFRLTSPGAEA